jgi:hypothetical protein
MKPCMVCSLRLPKPSELTQSAEVAINENPLNRVHGSDASTSIRDPRERSFIAIATEYKWNKAGVMLTVGFLHESSIAFRNRVLAHMNSWGEFCNVTFRYAQATEAQVRIGQFDTGDDYGLWSYLGTNVLNHKYPSPTMNLEGFTEHTSEEEFARVVRHEAGHTLGFVHEHRRPEILNNIDRQKAYAYYWEKEKWDEAETNRQVLTPLDYNIDSTPATDGESIMCYYLPGSIMTDGIGVPGGRDFTAQDRAFAAKYYPKPTP